MEAKQYATKNPMVNWKSQRGNKKYQKTNENEKTMIQNPWDETKAVSKSKVYSNKSLT